MPIFYRIVVPKTPNTLVQAEPFEPFGADALFANHDAGAKVQ